MRKLLTRDTGKREESKSFDAGDAPGSTIATPKSPRGSRIQDLELPTIFTLGGTRRKATSDPPAYHAREDIFNNLQSPRSGVEWQNYEQSHLHLLNKVEKLSTELYNLQRQVVTSQNQISDLKQNLDTINCEADDTKFRGQRSPAAEFGLVVALVVYEVLSSALKLNADGEILLRGACFLFGISLVGLGKLRASRHGLFCNGNLAPNCQPGEQICFLVSTDVVLHLVTTLNKKELAQLSELRIRVDADLDNLQQNKDGYFANVDDGHLVLALKKYNYNVLRAAAAVSQAVEYRHRNGLDKFLEDSPTASEFSTFQQLLGRQLERTSEGIIIRDNFKGLFQDPEAMKLLSERQWSRCFAHWNASVTAELRRLSKLADRPVLSVKHVLSFRYAPGLWRQISLAMIIRKVIQSAGFHGQPFINNVIQVEQQSNGKLFTLLAKGCGVQLRGTN